MKWISAFVFIVSTNAFAYPTPIDFNGRLSRWSGVSNDRPLTVSVISPNPYDGTYFGGLVDEASQIWSAVETSGLRLTAADPNLVEDILVSIVDSMEEAPFSAGYSSFDQFDRNGNPVHCTIKILSTLSYITFAKTVLHELGHCVGLGHSLIPEAIMSYQLSATEFALDTDDVAAISRLYPVDGSEPQLPVGCSVTKGSKTEQPNFWVLAPLLVLVLLRAGISMRKEKKRRSVRSPRKKFDLNEFIATIAVPAPESSSLESIPTHQPESRF